MTDRMLISPKVFGIGFHKTGTKSLAKALTTMGYRVTGPNATRQIDIAQSAMDIALNLVEHYDAFQDNPWPLLYKQLDQRIPNSKFILTIRDSEGWINSVCNYFGQRETPMRQWIYGSGSPIGNESLYLAKYQGHNQKVIQYFQHREKDLLVVNLIEQPAWQPLCQFLGKQVPDIAFPHINQNISIS